MEITQLIFSLFLSFLLLFPFIHEGSAADAAEKIYGSDNGYVEVREGAYMFWLYHESPNKTDYPKSKWPIILWLQGGPGSSGVGFGNFMEIGPMDNYLHERNSTWLGVADLLFVDNPVGTGFSYVTNRSLLVKSDDAAADDLTTLLISFFDEKKSLRSQPLYIVGESYGGKFAAKLGLKALDAINNEKLKVELGGIVLASSWISPLTYLRSWAPLLKDMSRLETKDVMEAQRVVLVIKEQVKAGNFVEAAYISSKFGANISRWGFNVSLYNFMLDNEPPPVKPKSADGNLTVLMNKIKKNIDRIPESVVWVEISDPVYKALLGDFLKSSTHDVDQLLALGVNVTIYSGQLDLICSTRGTEAWVENLKWSENGNFSSSERWFMTCGEKDPKIRGFMKSYKNLGFFWILNAGHYVVMDQPYIALRMIAGITQSPAYDEELCISLRDDKFK